MNVLSNKSSLHFYFFALVLVHNKVSDNLLFVGMAATKCYEQYEVSVT